MLGEAVKNGIPINASLIPGFGENVYPDLFLHPDISTTTLLPWRPENGKVIRMLCDITLQDGTPFAVDTRKVLKDAVEAASKKGIDFNFGSRIEFYLFKTDEEGNPTKTPCDNAGYMDIAPLDKCENVRREICLTLERMGILPTNSHHEAGPGQNQIDFASNDALKAADNVVSYITVVKTIAARYGLYADFSPKPLDGAPGNGFHINVLATARSGEQVLPHAIAGILKHIHSTTVFFNNSEQSYRRFGEGSAPSTVSWSGDNRGQLGNDHLRVPRRHRKQVRPAYCRCQYRQSSGLAQRSEKTRHQERFRKQSIQQGTDRSLLRLIFSLIQTYRQKRLEQFRKGSGYA